MKMKQLAILGSTGSIGKNALEIAANHRDKFRVMVLTAGTNMELFDRQIRDFSPEIVAVASAEAEEELKRRLGPKLSSSLTILSGPVGIAQAASRDEIDTVICAIVGAAGLLPVLSAARKGKTIGLANKESLVMAGRIVMEESRKHGAKILPVDSEHSAIFQCMSGHNRSEVKKVILTASGGPFAGRPPEELSDVTPEEALNHPRWRMGKKISIDSATLMNKGLEVIEAHHLFGLPPESIDVIIHPQSVVHSLVEFDDGVCIAQLSVPDMKGPISYAMTYPERLESVMESLCLHEVSSLTFMQPEKGQFPCLSLAYEALESGGTMPSVLNAANEIAVNAFLRGDLRFTDIAGVIKKTMESHSVMDDNDLVAVMQADGWARKKAEEVLRA